MVTSSLDPGGAETHIFELSRALLKMGHSVSVLSGGGSLLPQFNAAGIKTPVLPLQRKSPRAALASLIGLHRFLKQEGFDVVHAHARLPALYLSFFRRIPLFVTTAHWVFRADPLHRCLSRWGQKTLAVSPDIARYLTQNYRLPQERIRLTSNGIDTERFGSVSSSALENQTILHISRLDSGRSATAKRLIEITPMLSSRYPRLTLLIVGGGNKEEALRLLAEGVNEKIGKRAIVLIGAVNDPIPYLQNASVFVGVSRAALEAMSCSLPVILCGDEGYRSIFTPADKDAPLTNFCCRDSDPPDNNRLLRDLCTLLDNASLRRSLGDGNRRYVLENFKAEKMAKDALSLYTSLPHKNGGERILLAGFYGGGNLGDEAMLLGIIQMLSSANTERLTVLSHAPRKTRRAYGISAFGRLSFLWKLCLGKYDRLILGGGNLLQDKTSKRSLFFYLLLLRIARLRGLRFTVYGGIGPLSPKGERSTLPLLRAADRLYLRTEADLSYVRRVLPSAAARLLPDSALLLFAPTRAKERKVIIALKKGTLLPPHLVVHLRRLDLTPVFLAMSSEDFKTTERQGMQFGTQRLFPASVGELSEILAASSLVITSRLHAAILALNAATPALMLRDNGKCDGMAKLVAALVPAPPIISADADAIEASVSYLLSLPKATVEEARTALLQAFKKAQL